MAVRNIKLVFEIAGDKEYRDAVKNTNAEQKKLASELDVTKAAYATNANSMDALTAKQKNYSDIITTLEKKQDVHRAGINNAREAVEKYTKQLAELSTKQTELTAKYGANSNEALENAKSIEKVGGFLELAQRRENGYTAALNKTTVELGKYSVEQDKNSKYLAEAAIAADGCARSIDQYGNEVKEATPEQHNMNQSLESLAHILIAAGIQKGFNELVGLLKSTADSAIEFESALTGVFKTVDGTPEQLEKITLGIKELSTEIPVTTTEIAGVAEAAGQLGIATDDVLEFSRVMLDLGVSTNLSSEQAATSLAKFANITKMAAGDYERLGSTVVALGNNFATTEADIVNMAMKIASTGTQVGLTEPQIIALATALSSVGMEAEAGGSAVSKLMKNIEVEVKTGGDKLEQFAAVANMTAEEFTQAWGDNAVNALGLFVGGLNDVERNGKSSIEILDEMGITEIRTSDAALRLSNAFDVMVSTQEMANQAWEENTALAAEAELRYGTTESKIQLLNNSVDLLKKAIGEQLIPVIRDFIDAGDGGVRMLTDWVQANEWVVPTISALTTALGTLVTAVTGAMVISKLATAIMAAVDPVWLAVAAVAALAAGIVVFAATVPKAETEAEKLANETERLTDRVKETTTATKDARDAFEETSKSIEVEAGETVKLAKRLEELMAVEELSNVEKTELRSLIDQLNARLPTLALSFDEVAGTVRGYTGDIYDLIEAKRQLAQYENAERQYIAALDARDILTSDSYDLESHQRKLQREIRAMAEANPTFEYGVRTWETSEEYAQYESLKKQLGEVSKEYALLNKEIKENKQELIDAEAVIDEYVLAVKDKGDANADDTGATKTATAAVINYTSALKDNSDEIKLSEAEHRKIDATYQGNANTVEALTEKVSALNQEYNFNQERINLLKKAIADGTAALDASSDDYEKSAAQIKAYRLELTNTETAQITLGKEINTTTNYLKDAKSNINGVTELLDENGKAVISTKKIISGASDEVIEKAEEVSATIVTASGESEKAVAQVADAIKTEMVAAADAAVEAGEAIAQSIAAGVEKTKSVIADQTKAAALTAVAPISDDSHPQTLAPKFISAGESVGQNIATGITQSSSVVAASAAGLAQVAIDSFISAAEGADPHEWMLKFYNESTQHNPITAEQFERIFGGYDAFDETNAVSATLMNTISSMGIDLNSATVEIHRYRDLVYGLEREIFEIRDALGNVFWAGNKEGYLQNGEINEEYWREHERIATAMFNAHAAMKYDKIGEDTAKTILQLSDNMGEYADMIVKAQEVWELGGEAWGVYEQHIEQQGLVADLQSQVKDQYDRMLQTYVYTDADGVKYYNETAVKSYEELIEKLKEAEEQIISTGKAYDELVESIKDGTAEIKYAVEEVAEEIQEFIPEYETMVNIEDMEKVFSADQIGFHIAQQLASGFDVGVRDSAGKIVSGAEYLADTMKSTTEKELGIHSPSKVFEEYGKNTAEGFILGLREAFGENINNLDLNPPELRAKISQYHYLTSLPVPQFDNVITNNQVVNQNRTASPTIYIAQKENESQYELARKIIEQERRMIYG